MVSKYHNQRTFFDGRVYHSKAEAAYALQLELRRMAGEITSWEPQVKVPLTVNGQKVCDYIADFAVTLADGRCQLHEVKGHETREWKLKRRLLEITYLRDHPEIQLIVHYVGATGTRPKPPTRKKASSG